MTNSNRSPLNRVGDAIDTMQTARAHAERVRAEMGDAWVADLIAYHETNTRAAIAEYMTTVTATDPEIRASIERNLTARAGL